MKNYKIYKIQKMYENMKICICENMKYKFIQI